MSRTGLEPSVYPDDVVFIPSAAALAGALRPSVGLPREWLV
jgi:hypothetical protein